MPADTIMNDERDLRRVRDYFFNTDWYRIYNLMEFVVNNYSIEFENRDFIELCNEVLEKEKSGYRFIGKQIVPITDKIEIMEVEEAPSSPFGAVQEHIQKAISLMSDKQKPDFPNSIKESISTVEAMCRIICSKDATLGDALDMIEKEEKVKMHGALKRAFDSLYGYASSAGGIRHAHGLLDNEAELKLEDAKFMLISCSARAHAQTKQLSIATASCFTIVSSRYHLRIKLYPQTQPHSLNYALSTIHSHTLTHLHTHSYTLSARTQHNYCRVGARSFPSQSSSRVLISETTLLSLPLLSNGISSTKTTSESTSDASRLRNRLKCCVNSASICFSSTSLSLLLIMNRKRSILF